MLIEGAPADCTAFWIGYRSSSSGWDEHVGNMGLIALVLWGAGMATWLVAQ